MEEREAFSNEWRSASGSAAVEPFLSRVHFHRQQVISAGFFRFAVKSSTLFFWSCFLLKGISA
ncbi:hypothetical protein HA48_07740 [Pantoea wallisii]|uniref:Uncharacterized protein n=1 Tax=Pantoea wallisii TaxID=1076551 RepID=A0A1X1DAQ7_9GAMM|nr:hypothetical protein HA48_07740 [Pantoea wallisii]